MLQIENIYKQYVTGELVQTALNGVSLNLREQEFVAILGPSGSGKTTLLNVIGGLDRYDSGDLIINGISTKKYKDRDWDSYRNHTIGFVFQSYNLIPHQSVLANVELALTISGISRKERRRRAAKALEDVGLGNQLHKRPSQMSGGQMQRVAIARALVNNPDILLADEPTGALDSETSVQVMELLKEVSRERLVVMVTHNPELAEAYASRIVRVRDGSIVGDTNPLEVAAGDAQPRRHQNLGRASMSYFTSLALSFNNLRTKKARTLLTAFAGSIGIIGIALIMSLSTGFQRYIDKIQEDTLSNYPLVIQSETADMASAFAAFGASLSKVEDAQDGTVAEQQLIQQMFANIGVNDLESFKAYLLSHEAEMKPHINAIKYGYGIKPRLYSADTEHGIRQVNPSTLMARIMGNSMMSSFMESDVFQEMLDNRELLDSQYRILQGRWPQNYREVVVVLTGPNEISDYMAYALGLKDPETLNEMIALVMQGKEVNISGEPMAWTYEDLMNLEFRLVSVPDTYSYNEEYQVWEDMSTDEDYMKTVIGEGETIQVVGIVCPKEGVSATALTAGVAYLPELTQHVIDTAAQSQIVKSQLADETVDVFTGNGFAENVDTELNFEDLISVDSGAISSAFGMNISEESIKQLLKNYLQEVAGSLDVDTAPAQQAFLSCFSQLAQEMLEQYVANHVGPDGVARLYLTQAESVVDSYLSGSAAQMQLAAIAQAYSLPVDVFSRVYRPLLVGMLGEYISTHMVQLPSGQEPTQPDNQTETVPSVTQAPDDSTTPELPDITLPSIELDPDGFYATLSAEQIPELVSVYLKNPVVTGTATVMSQRMMQTAIQKAFMEKISSFGQYLQSYIGSSFYVDKDKIASAFQFNMDTEQFQRLMTAMTTKSQDRSARSNLQTLGYANTNSPISMSIYLTDFAGKEAFQTFLENYNSKMRADGQEDQVIRYTDVTGIMMSSVRTIIDAISYALIAFVAVSLVVSSIMIGIITYISVMERTKEIGVLRAIGASKQNISQVFNAETFIIGLCSGLIGIGITLLILIPGNALIHHLTGSQDITAQLPVTNALVLIVLSVLLTLIGGIIPAKKAAKKDPVIALRSE